MGNKTPLMETPGSRVKSLRYCSGVTRRRMRSFEEGSGNVCTALLCLANAARYESLQPDDAAVQTALKNTTTKVLASLTPREERVLRMRFGVGMNTDHTLEEVGLQFSVTRERIRQIEAKALRKLKHPSRSKQLKSFLES